MSFDLQIVIRMIFTHEHNIHQILIESNHYFYSLLCKEGYIPLSSPHGP